MARVAIVRHFEFSTSVEMPSLETSLDCHGRVGKDRNGPRAARFKTPVEGTQKSCAGMSNRHTFAHR
jgi:hypothetical protein